MLSLMSLLGCMRSVQGGCADTVAVDTALLPEETETVVTSEAVVLRGAVIAGESPFVGEVVDVRLEDGRITAIGSVSDADATIIDLAGHWLAPAFIDSHVHLAYRRDGPGMLDGGVAAAVDLAAPESFFAEDLSPLTLLRSGPMVTAVGGYPTQGWGAGGYGLECAGTDDAVAAVEALAGAGAGVIKLPITGSSVLSSSALTAAADRAHELGLKVASHALSDDSALLAVSVGVDVLAHTPTSSLSEAAVDALSESAVISTLAAFGGSEAAIDNLRRLRESGAVVLYGTDFGNLSTAGIIGAELSLMAASGMSGEQILDAGTVTAADWWGLDGLGRIEVGARASLLVLEADPGLEPMTLAEPVQVWIAGKQR